VAYFPRTHLVWSAEDYRHFEAIRAPLMSRIGAGCLHFLALNLLTILSRLRFGPFSGTAKPQSERLFNSEAGIKPAVSGHSQLAVERSSRVEIPSRYWCRGRVSLSKKLSPVRDGTEPFCKRSHHNSVLTPTPFPVEDCNCSASNKINTRLLTDALILDSSE
jgi:hypothetical protein